MEDQFAYLASMAPSLLLAAGLIAVSVLGFAKRAWLGDAASRLLGVGAAVGALSALFTAWWVAFGFRTLYDMGAGSYSAIMSAVSLVQMLVHLAWLGMIVAAVFVRRPGQAAPPARAYPVMPAAAQPGSSADSGSGA